MLVYEPVISTDHKNICRTGKHLRQLFYACIIIAKICLIMGNLTFT